ncbi:sugar phosphate isomerase/epimerase family protein [Fimbriiglobus ruber]|uniref:Putative isomerase n=1 Tax=Fimbriiglobus ruber TaxID=1908690 RepID=A0A225DXV7_9BACT|nr:sugar phosphate isomerase/epimerase family protein [Fimbriiglobus ruber]OWK46370.1 putative isomerase [Fimbriiglobus ruber]
MFLGYNTNGFAHHRLDDAIDILADLGYQGVALTPDVHHLDPASVSSQEIDAFGRRLTELGLRCVIETGARFVLDPRRKHQPTLLSAEDSGRRLEFLTWCVDLAQKLGADCVSFWSGTASDDAPRDALMGRLVDGCRRLADAAVAKNVRLAFEPEPGMFIETMDQFAELHDRVNHPSFGLTVDVGHLVCNGELPVSRHLERWSRLLWNIHIEDMRRGIHDHVLFGDGEVDFADVFAGLAAARYKGGVYVELSRHSHDAVNTARKAKLFLDRYVAGRA